MGRIDPVRWAVKAGHDRPKTAGLTDWFPGTLAPARKGIYERYFTDSMLIPAEDSMQLWDGRFWMTSDGRKHWRQVGDYPAWRGVERGFKLQQG